MQRTATPLTPVRFRPAPPLLKHCAFNNELSSPDGEIGRHTRLKILRLKERAGSIPAPGTNSKILNPCGAKLQGFFIVRLKFYINYLLFLLYLQYFCLSNLNNHL